MATKDLNAGRIDTHRRRNIVWKRKMVDYTLLAICFVASRFNRVASQKTEGETCVLNNGDIGVCRSLLQCMTAVHKAFEGEKPIVCSIKMDDPIVCCWEGVHIKPHPTFKETPRNIISDQIQFQEPPRAAHNVYVFDSEGHEVPRRTREDMETPWWFIENIFAPSDSSTDKPSTNRPSTSRPSTGNVPHYWWMSENPFMVAPPFPPPTQTPRPTRREPSPITERPRPTRKPTPQTVAEHISTSGNERISEIKCREYSRLVTSQISVLPLIPEPEPVHIDIPKCDFNSVVLIVGGEEAKLKEFPHMTALGYVENGKIDWKCGGSLISEYYVLTAAHCASKNNEPTIARLGDLNLKLDDEGAAPVNYIVEKIILHPDYKSPAKYNDIALLKLDRRVVFSDFIRPACLYTRDTFEVNKTVATGWGKIDFAEQRSDKLLKVGISIIDNKLCNELYEDQQTRKLKNGITSTMMCAGELEGGKDTCQGDSGGPIQITRHNNKCIFSIIGITSFGKFCASKNAPGVYTRVSSFVPWIEGIVWGQS